MLIVRDVDKMAPAQRPVLALGNFDGVHLGHQAILRAAVERARACSAPALALTFEPAPARVLTPARAPCRLCNAEDKLELFERCGLDGAIVLEFTRALSLLAPAEFARRYLAAKIGAQIVVVGHNVSFGHNRAGDAAALRELGRALGFETVVVGPVKAGTLEVSSTLIRRFVQSGEVRRARELLGRNYFIRGTVVRGRGRGRLLGFPTINLELESECVPADGIYATLAGFNGSHYPSVTSIGFRPTFNETERAVEAHLIDFSDLLYGRRIKLEFVERLREERKFDSPQALAERMRLDVEQARAVLAAL
ncbi:MAG: bifunctional riboflavin kinase/FAD synthetase [Deltaproteobacteria bacterium]|jgi:riboflavin kinase/FMN adenylyltransferase|nr:bifunctional riboflavin kinase/FAD synthetase [Deltaproteobacteria bacterium]